VGVSDLKIPEEDKFDLETGDLPEFQPSNDNWQNVTNTVIDVMLGEFGFDEILKTPGMDNLHIINAGQGLLNPAEILRSPRFKDFLHEVREIYDVIIVDTPPVLPVADAFEVAPEVDGVILVYEVGRIGRGILHRAKVQLENVNSNVLGVILNNVKPDVAPDFYRYRTDYYYEQKSDQDTSTPYSRWKNLINQGIGRIRSTLSKVRLASATAGKGRNLLILSVIIGLVLVAGLLWISSPDLSSSTSRSQSRRGKIVLPKSGSEASTKLPGKSSRTKAVATRAPVQRNEPTQAKEKSLSMAEQSAGKVESPAPKSTVMKKPAQIISSQQSKAQTREDYPQLASIRSGPSFQAPVLQPIQQGTRLEAVGKKGNWLKLRLSDGSTGWIYHSPAQPEPEPAEKPVTVVTGAKETSADRPAQSMVIKKSSSTDKALSTVKNGAETYTSLPKVARIRSQPSIHSPVLHRVRRGKRLQVVGRKGAWLKLQLRNGSTGWIYHSLAEPARKSVDKPQSVLKERKGASERHSAQAEVKTKTSPLEEVLSSMQNGSEAALFYPE
jgi:capsular exopolysaccharide synthesis family protein